MKYEHVLISDCSETNFPTNGQRIYMSKSGRYWLLGNYRDGKVISTNIKVELEPDKMYVKLKNKV